MVDSSSPEVTKSYLSFALDKIWETGQIQSGSLQKMRGIIVSLWRRINIIAPELTNRFQIIEAASRINPNDSSLPEPATAESQRNADDAVMKKAEETRKPEDIERAIRTAARLKDFDKARELANLFQNEKRKKMAFNEINSEEAIELIKNDDLSEAEKLAVKIDEPKLVLKVYSLLIKAFDDNKDKSGAKDLAYEAVKRLKNFDDRILLPFNLSQLAKVTSKIDAELAFDLLNETVKAVNQKNFKVETGDIGFDKDVFRQLAKIDEERSRQTANILSDNLRKIVALSSIYEWKAKELVRKEKESAANKKTD